MKQLSFITSFLTFYLKGLVRIDNDFFRAKVPNTILKMIPLGANNFSIPCTQIGNIDDSFRVRFGALIWGIIITIVGYNYFSDKFLLGLILLLYVISIILNSFEVILTIGASSGNEYIIRFMIFEKSKMYTVKEWVEEIIRTRHYDTNVRIHSERQTNAIVDAINRR